MSNQKYINPSIAEKNNSHRKYFLWGTAFLFFILFGVLNIFYPLYADDWGYFTRSFSNSDADYNIISKIIERQHNQYFTWGGRVIVHSIAHFLLWLGDPWYNILNTLIFIAYLYLVYKIANKNNPDNYLLFTVLTILVWFATPSFNYVFFWKVGAANYLWSTFLILLFLYPFYSYYISEKCSDSIFKCILFFFAGIIAGWTNENMVVGLASFIISLFVLLRYEKRPIPRWMIFGLLGVLVGGLFMLAAPGNYIRSEVVNENMSLSDKSLLYNIGYRVLKVGYRYVVYVLPVVLLYCVMFYFYRKYADKDKYGKVFRASLLFFFSGHIACLAMVGSAIFPQRAIFGIISLLIVSIGILYTDIDFPKHIRRQINYRIIPILCLVFIINYGFVFSNFYHFYDITKKREKFLDLQKEMGNKYIIFTDSVVLPPRYQVDDLSENPDFWINRMYSIYHEVDSVSVIK